MATQVRAFAKKPGYVDSQEVTATYVIPALPTGLAARGAWTTTMFVSWDSVPGAASYTVLRDTSSSFPSPLYLYPATTSFTDVALAPGITYYYRVRAVYAAGNGDLSVAVSGMTLLPSQEPVVQTVNTNGLAAPTVIPAGAPSPEFWKGTVQPGWVAGAYTYVVWDPDNQNWGSFAIAAYDAGSNLVGQWVIAGNRYITSITLDGATGNFVFVGQDAKVSQVPWYTIMLP